MFKILQQPYPYPEQTLFQRVLQCIKEGVFIAGFLIIFQPFGASMWQNPNKNMYLLGYGIITMAAGLVIRISLPNVFKVYFKESTWTIAKEVQTTLLLLAFITLGNVFYTNSVFDMSFRFRAVMEMFASVLIIGMFPIAFGIAVNYIYKLKKYSQPVVVVPTQNNQIQAEQSTVIKFVADNEKDFLEINTADFLFIESSDNYATVYFLQNKSLQKQLIRSSLSRLETQVSDPNIARCHRSYVVNLVQVVRVSGNAQGYKFHFKTFDLSVPVARKYSELVEKLR